MTFFTANSAKFEKRQTLSCVFVLFLLTLIGCLTYRLFSYMYFREFGRINDPYSTMITIFNRKYYTWKIMCPRKEYTLVPFIVKILEATIYYKQATYTGRTGTF